MWPLGHPALPAVPYFSPCLQLPGDQRQPQAPAAVQTELLCTIQLGHWTALGPHVQVVRFPWSVKMAGE